MIAAAILIIIVLMLVIAGFLVHYEFDAPGFLLTITGICLLITYPMLVDIIKG